MLVVWTDGADQKHWAWVPSGNIRRVTDSEWDIEEYRRCPKAPWHQWGQCLPSLASRRPSSKRLAQPRLRPRWPTQRPGGGVERQGTAAHRPTAGRQHCEDQTRGTRRPRRPARDDQALAHGLPIVEGNRSPHSHRRNSGESGREQHLNQTPETQGQMVRQ